MVEHVGFRIQHRIERGFVAVEIRDEDLDFALRIQRAHLANCGGPMRRAAVRQIIAIHGSNHRMREIQMPHCFGDVARFGGVKRARLTLAHRTKSAVTRADIAAEHKGSSAVSPALKDVWTLCFLTNRVQVQALNQLQQVILVGRIAQTNPQPFRFWLTRFAIED